MTNVRAAAAAKPVSHRAHHLNPEDLKTAAKLKPAINKLLMQVRFGSPLKPSEMPRRGRETGWTAPNGDKLFQVQLSSPPPPGAADFPTDFALVNPKTNQFYSMTAGGQMPGMFGHGPLALPDGLKFKTKNMTRADLNKLEAAANKEAIRPKMPSSISILNALGAYQFQNMITWSFKGPASKDVLGEVKLKADQRADGNTYTGLVLKSDPRKVVILRTSGLAGLVQYSQPLDLDRLPK